MYDIARILKAAGETTFEAKGEGLLLSSCQYQLRFQQAESFHLFWVLLPDELLTWNRGKPSVRWHAWLLPRGVYPIVLDTVRTDAALSHIELFQAF